jgi:hypothetical protein
MSDRAAIRLQPDSLAELTHAGLADALELRDRRAFLPPILEGRRGRRELSGRQRTFDFGRGSGFATVRLSSASKTNLGTRRRRQL